MRENDEEAEVYLKVVGWGPFRLPGERRRMRRALQEARRMLEQVEEARRRGKCDRGDSVGIVIVVVLLFFTVVWAVLEAVAG